MGYSFSFDLQVAC